MKFLLALCCLLGVAVHHAAAVCPVTAAELHWKVVGSSVEFYVTVVPTVTFGGTTTVPISSNYGSASTGCSASGTATLNTVPPVDFLIMCTDGLMSPVPALPSAGVLHVGDQAYMDIVFGVVTATGTVAYPSSLATGLGTDCSAFGIPGGDPVIRSGAGGVPASCQARLQFRDADDAYSSATAAMVVTIDPSIPGNKHRCISGFRSTNNVYLSTFCTGESTRSISSPTSCDSFTDCSCDPAASCTGNRAAWFDDPLHLTWQIRPALCVESSAATVPVAMTAACNSGSSLSLDTGAGIFSGSAVTVSAPALSSTSQGGSTCQYTTTVSVSAAAGNANQIHALPLVARTSDGQSHVNLVPFIVNPTHAAPTGSGMGVSPLRFPANSAAVVEVSGLSGLVRSPALACRLVLEQHSKVVLTRATYVSSSKVRCTVPPRPQLTDNGLDDAGATQVTITVSNAGSCGPFSSQSVIFNYLNACPAGKYLNSAKTACSNCPTGRYLPTSGSESSSDCTPCPPGKYGSSTGLATSDCSGSCPAGSYCTQGTTNPSQCLAGYYGSSTGLSTPSCNGECTAGYYCTAGSTSATQHPCSAGRWGNTGETNSNCAGQCDWGHYCPAGSSSYRQSACGSNLAMCPTVDQSAVNAVACPAGVSSPQCSVAGKYTHKCDVAGQCWYLGTAWAGKYSTGDGVLHNCPAGRYGASSGAATSGCSGPCREGFRCPQENTSPNPYPCVDRSQSAATARQYYCPAGRQLVGLGQANGAVRVSDGYYTTPESGDAYTRRSQTACTYHFMCNSGTRAPKMRLIAPGVCSTDWPAYGSTWQPGNGSIVRENSNGAELFTVSARNYMASTRPTLSITSMDVYDQDGNLNPPDCSTSVSYWFGDTTTAIDSSAATFRVTAARDHNYEKCNRFVLNVRAVAPDYTVFPGPGNQISLDCLVDYRVENANDAPHWIPSEITAAVDENPRQGAKVGSQVARLDNLTTYETVPHSELQLLYQLFDEDKNQEMNFSIVSQPASKPFVISGCSGQLSVVRSEFNPGMGDFTLNYEVDQEMTVRVRLCDDGRPDDNVLCDSINYRITIRDVNEAPYFTVSPGSFSMRIPEDVSYDTQVGRQLDSSGLTYEDPDIYAASTGLSNNDAAVYLLGESLYLTQLGNGQLVTKRALDFEERPGGTFSVDLQVCDAMLPTAACSEAESFTVQMIDRNDPPEVCDETGQATSAIELSVPETFASVAVGWVYARDVDYNSQFTFAVARVWAVGGTPMVPVHVPVATSTFVFGTQEQVTSNQRPSLGRAELRVGTTPLDYESFAEYVVELRFQDNGLTVQDAAHGTDDPTPLVGFSNITVKVTDENEAPTLIVSGTYSVEENQLAGVLSPPLQATDPDVGPGPTTNTQTVQLLSFVIPTDTGTNPTDVPFTVDSSSGQLRTRRALDYETNAVYSLIVDVRDSGTPSMRDRKTITINVIDVNEPAVIAPNQEFNVPENTAASTVVGSVSYLDPDAGDSAVLTIVDGTAGWEQAFQMLPSGQIIVVPGASDFFMTAALNYEVQNRYSLVVNATDSRGLSYLETVFINVLNVQEPPYPTVWQLYMFDIQTAGAVLGRLGAIDQDAGDTWTWSFVSVVDHGATTQCSALFTAASLNATTGQVSLQAQPNYVSDSGCNVTYTLSDQVGTSATYELFVVLQVENIQPVIHAYPQARVMVSELQSPDVAVAGSEVRAYDLNKFQDIRWSVVDAVPGQFKSYFVMVPVPGVSQPSTANHTAELWVRTPVNFEDPAFLLPTPKPAVDRTVELVIRASDVGEASGLFTEVSITVQITGENEAPVINPFVTGGLNIAENYAGALPYDLGTVQVTDEDEGSSFTVAVSPVPDATAAQIACFPVAVNQAGSVVTVRIVEPGAGCDLEGYASPLARALDYEGMFRGGISFLLSATDNTGLVTTEEFSVVLVDVNEAPVLPPAPVLLAQETDFAQGTPVANLNGSDPDILSHASTGWATLTYAIVEGVDDHSWFAIDSAGVLLLNTDVLDFELKQFLNVTVNVTDGGGLSDTQQYAIEVANLNDITLDFTSEVAAAMSSMPTDGSAQVLLSGTNLGYKDTARPFVVRLRARRCDTASDCVPVSEGHVGACAAEPSMVSGQLNNTHVLCNLPVGTGTDVTITLEVQHSSLPGQPIDTFDITSRAQYRQPQVDSVTPSHAGGWPTDAAGSYIDFVGRDLGPDVVGVSAPTWLKATYSYSHAQASQLPGAKTVVASTVYISPSCVVITPHTHVRCLAAPGAGRGLLWDFRVGGQSQNYTMSPVPLSRYAAPQITSVTVDSAVAVAPTLALPAACASGAYIAPNATLNTRGGDRVVIRGTNFGPSVLSSGSVFQAAVYAPVNSSFAPGPSDPFQPLQVSSGAQLYSTGSVLFRATCAVLVPHVALQCTTAPGAGQRLLWSVEIMQQLSNIPSGTAVTTHYNPPRVFDVVENLATQLPPSQMNTEGDSLLYVRGDQFGPGSLTQQQISVYLSTRLGVPVANLFKASKCRVGSRSGGYDVLLCDAPAGAGKDLFVQVEVLGSRDACWRDVGGTATAAAYHPPVVTTYRGPGSSLALTAGQQRIDILGRYFGPEHPEVKLNHIRYASQQPAYSDVVFEIDVSTCNMTIPHERLSCLTSQGVGRELVWNVTVNGQTNTQASTSYDPPEIHEVGGAGTFSSVAARVRVVGKNFGPANEMVHVTHAGLERGIVYLAPGDVCLNRDPAFTCSDSDYRVSCDVDNHVAMNCTIQPGFSPPGASVDLDLQYNMHVRVRKQMDLKTAPAGMTGSKFYFAEPGLLRLEHHPNLETIDPSRTINGACYTLDPLDVRACPYSSGTEVSGARQRLQIVGRNLGVFDPHVQLTVEVAGTPVPTSDVSVFVTADAHDVVVFPVPVGVGRNVPVRLLAEHSMFPAETFVLPVVDSGGAQIGSELRYSYTTPSLGTISTPDRDEPGKPGYEETRGHFPADIEPRLQLINVSGLSFGSVGVQLGVNGSAMDWPWGPRLDQLYSTLTLDPTHGRPTVRPFSMLPGAPDPAPASMGWVWVHNTGSTGNNTFADMYSAAAASSNVSASAYVVEYGGFTWSPLPRQYVASWEHEQVVIRLPRGALRDEFSNVIEPVDNSYLVMLCPGFVSPSTGLCTSARSVEPLTFDMATLNTNCDKLNVPTAGGYAGMAAADVDDASLTLRVNRTGDVTATAATCSANATAVFFLSNPRVPTKAEYRVPPAIVGGVCEFTVWIPAGAGSTVAYKITVLSTDTPTPGCRIGYRRPELLDAYTNRTARGEADGPARDVGSTVATSTPGFNPLFGGQMPPKAEAEVPAGTLAVVSNMALADVSATALTIKVPTAGAHVTLSGLDLGAYQWQGSPLTAAYSNEQAFALFVKYPHDYSAQLGTLIAQGAVMPAAAALAVTQLDAAGVLQPDLVLLPAARQTSAEVWVPSDTGAAQTALAVRTADQSGMQYVAIVYEEPFVDSISPNLANTTGGIRARITGWNFGVNASLIDVFVGGERAAGVVMVRPHTEIEVTVPEGVGRDNLVEVVVHGRSCAGATPSRCAARFHFAPPVVTGVSQSLVRTNGTDELCLHGWNFGAQRFQDAALITPMLQFVPTRAGDLMYTVPDPLANIAPSLLPQADLYSAGGQLLNVSHNQICFVVPQLQGGDRTIVAYIAAQQSSGTVSVSIEPPTIFAVRPGTAPAHGFLADFEGQNLGRHELALPAAVRALLEAQAPASLPPHSNARFTRYPGDKSGQNGLSLQIVAPGGTLLPCSPFTDPSSTTTYDHGDLRAAYNFWSWIDSNRWDPAAQLRVSEHIPPSLHTYHFCVLPAGFGTNLEAVYSLDGVAGTGSFRFNYSEPLLYQVQPNTPDAQGVDNLVLMGADYGPVKFGNLNNTIYVQVGNDTCSNAHFYMQGGVADTEMVMCDLGRTTVGSKKIYMSIAGYYNMSYPRVDDISELEGFLGLVSGGNTSTNVTARALLQENPMLYNLDGSQAGRLRDAMDEHATSVAVRPVARNLYRVDIGRSLQSVPSTTADDRAPHLVVSEEQVEADRLPFLDLYQIHLMCDRDFYGQPGEYCEPCPSGGVCAGGNDAAGCVNDNNAQKICTEFVEPISGPGYWFTAVPTTDPFCHGPRQPGANPFWGTGRPGRFAQACPALLPCEPQLACLGNNTCEVGYRGERCFQCDIGFFRQGGLCMPCPSNIVVLVIMLLLFLAAVCTAGYIMNRKQISLAFVSIGVDYAQVLSIFGKSRISFPPQLRELFRYLSLFSIDINITPPECMSPNISWKNKWLLVTALPVGVGFMLLILFVVVFLYNKFVKGMSFNKSKGHAITIQAMTYLLLYYSYLAQTRNAMDGLNCQDTDPPTGVLRVFADPQTICYQGDHLVIFPLALAMLLGYSFGYPAWIIAHLRKHKDVVKTDQLLRAMGTGNTQTTNAYLTFRRKYSKLYYMFLPGKWYWMGVFLARKLAVSFTALSFSRSPSFQMALIFLILFASYSVHVRSNPFMSMSSRKAVILHHQDKVKKGDKRHMEIQAMYAKSAKNAKRSQERRGQTMDSVLSAGRDGQDNFIFDYNTLEAVLLASGCFVALAGVMFETGTGTGPAYDAQRATLTALVIGIVLLSLSYFAVVFASEVFVQFGIIKRGPATRKETYRFFCGLAWAVFCCCPCSLWACWPFFRHRGVKEGDKKAALSAAADKRRAEIDLEIEGGGDNSSFGMNPLALRKQANEAAEEDAKKLLESSQPPSSQHWALLQSMFKQIEASISEIEGELSTLQTGDDSPSGGGGDGAAAAGSGAAAAAAAVAVGGGDDPSSMTSVTSPLAPGGRTA